MSELLFFIMGLVIGGLVGVVMMCILQINSCKYNSTPSSIEIDDEKCEKEM